MMLKRFIRNLYNKIKPVQLTGSGNKFNSKSKIGDKFIVKEGITWDY